MSIPTIDPTNKQTRNTSRMTDAWVTLGGIGDGVADGATYTTSLRGRTFMSHANTIDKLQDPMHQPLVVLAYGPHKENWLAASGTANQVLTLTDDGMGILIPTWEDSVGGGGQTGPPGATGPKGDPGSGFNGCEGVYTHSISGMSGYTPVTKLLVNHVPFTPGVLPGEFLTAGSFNPTGFYTISSSGCYDIKTQVQWSDGGIGTNVGFRVLEIVKNGTTTLANSIVQANSYNNIVTSQNCQCHSILNANDTISVVVTHDNNVIQNLLITTINKGTYLSILKVGE